MQTEETKSTSIFAGGILDISCGQSYDPRDICSDDTLRDLAKHSPERNRGEINPAQQKTLAICLPDICGELIAYRAAFGELK